MGFPQEADVPIFPDLSNPEVRSLAPHISPEDFAFSWETYASVRGIITQAIPAPRRILYIGMCDDWATPFAAADADRVTGVDVAYWGLDKSSADVQRFTVSGRPREPKSRYEARSFVLEITDLQRMMSEMTMTFGIRPEIHRPWIPGGHYSMKFVKDGRRRHIDFLMRDIDRWHPQKESFPLIMMQRTFPGPVSWGRLIGSLEVGGLLFTTGFGYGRQDTRETGSGMDIDNSPVPLYFSPETIGLTPRASHREGAWYLYEKFEPVKRSRVEAVVQAGGHIDALLDEQYLTDVIAKMKVDKQGFSTDKFYPKPEELLPIVSNQKSIEEELTLTVGSVVGESAAPNVWVSIGERAIEQLQNLEAGKYDSRIARQAPYWDSTDYLPDDLSLAETLRVYYERVAAIAQQKAFS